MTSYVVEKAEIYELVVFLFLILSVCDLYNIMSIVCDKKKKKTRQDKATI